MVAWRDDRHQQVKIRDDSGPRVRHRPRGQGQELVEWTRDLKMESNDDEPMLERAVVLSS